MIWKFTKLVSTSVP